MRTSAGLSYINIIRSSITAMDWTGGIRKRYTAGKNNQVLQKQKAHFAKVRSKLQSTPKSERLVRSSTREFHSSRRGVSSRHADRDRVMSVCTENKASEVSIKAQSPLRKKHAVETDESRQAMHHGRQSSSNAFEPCGEGDQFQLAIRRQLLGRKDWLGLSFARPLQMDFASRHEKDRIGKRRKIKRSTHQPKPAGARLLTPLFDKTVARQGCLLDDALPVDEMSIRIGTDAFASQKLCSERAQTPETSHIRQSSANFTSLSEESMLLGADGDKFEASGPVRLSQGSSAGLLAISAATLEECQGLASHKHRLDFSARQMSHECGELPCRISQDRNGLVEERPLGSEFEHGHQGQDNSLLNFVSKSAQAERRNHSRHDVQNAFEAETEEATEQEYDQDDETWRQLMHVQRYTSSHASRSALPSSSQHLTTSGSSRSPALLRIKLPETEQCPEIATPQGCGTYDTLRSASDLPSSSESLKNIQRLSAKSKSLNPSGGLEQATNDDPDQQLWRSYFDISNTDSDHDSEI